MARPESGLAEFSLRSAEGDVPVASICVRALSNDQLARAARQYKRRDSQVDCPARRLPRRRGPRKEFGQPQKPVASAAGKAIVPYVRSYLQVVYPYSAPQEGELGKSLTATMAQDEYEPAAFGVYAGDKDLSNVQVRIESLRHESDQQARLEVSVRTAEYALVQNNPSRSKEKTYAIFPQRLWPMYPTQVKKGESSWFWVTFRSDPKITAPGLYKGRAVITADQGRATLDVEVRVLPIQLVEMNQTDLRMGGCVSGLAPRHEMETMLRYNHNMINLWLAGVEPKLTPRGQDDFDLDFTLMDDFMAQMKAAGLQANVYFLGGDPYKFPQTLTLERELAKQVLGMTNDQFVALANQDKMNIAPQIVPLYRKWVAKVMQHAREKGWPEQILTPFDEPASWQQKIGNSGPWIRGHFDQGCQMIHEMAPGTRVYGSIHHAVKGLNYLSVIDIFCTNAIEDDPHLGDKVRAEKKVFWQYSGTGRNTPNEARYTFGFYFGAFDSRGSLCWAYNWGDRLDTTEGSNWEYAWYTPLDVVPAPYYEGLREAWDDRRYVETLKKVAREKNVDVSVFLAEIAEAGQKLHGEGGRDTRDDFWTQAKRVEALDELRGRVARKILEVDRPGNGPGTARNE